MKLGFPLMPPGISKISIGTFTRAAAGNQAVTGLGFAPKVIIFLANESGVSNLAASTGFDNVAQKGCIYIHPTLSITYSSTTRSIVAQKDATNFIRGFVASMDADGFTVTWDMTGAASATVIYLAMR